MEGPLLQAPASATGFAASESSEAPFAQEMVVVTKQDHIQLKWAASYWKAQYDRAAAREAALKQEVAAHQAKSRDLPQRLYGKKSEKGAGQKPGPPLG